VKEKVRREKKGNIPFANDPILASNPTEAAPPRSQALNASPTDRLSTAAPATESTNPIATRKEKAKCGLPDLFLTTVELFSIDSSESIALLDLDLDIRFKLLNNDKIDLIVRLRGLEWLGGYKPP
jgi:hypothetical protein